MTKTPAASTLPAAAAGLVRRLADGRFHSGTRLARELGISRTAVWKQIERLGRLGLEIHAVRGKGYRLARPMELLTEGEVRAAMEPAAEAALATMEIFDVVDSTSAWLRRASPVPPAACLAECQTAGRGRRGRRWLSPFGAALYLSLAWRFEAGPGLLGGLSVAVGVMACEALERLDVTGVGLKWPNDLVYGGAKLGGVLVEMTGEGEGPTTAIVGVGINVRMPPHWGAEVDQPWTELAALPGVSDCSRNRLAGVLLSCLVAGLERFGRAGLDPFLPAWTERDVVRGREIEIRAPGGARRGLALGVDRNGALLVDTGGHLWRLTAGEVSVRGWRGAAAG